MTSSLKMGDGLRDAQRGRGWTGDDDEGSSAS
jgi:hypothetical protein